MGYVRDRCCWRIRSIGLLDQKGQDHRFIKRRVNPGLGFGTFSTAQQTIQGYEAMHMLRKGQLEGIAKGDVLAQNQVINQLFGLVA